MYIFIWDYIEELTANYHSQGGAAVIAESVSRAKEMLSENAPVPITQEPDAVYPITAAEERKFIFPDAGCC